VMFGSPETTTGGNALKFYASVRLDVRRIGAIKEAGPPGKDMVVVGNRTRVKVVKNKLAAPFREVEFDILYGQGVSRSGEIVDMASDLNIVQKSGAWFSVDGERIGQGRDNARIYLEQHPELLEKLEQKILAASGIARGGDASSAPAAPPAEQKPQGKAAPPAEQKPQGKGEADGARPPANGSAKPRQPTPARPS
ncbi:MAG TPA: DNA recombination/repair protein RecA, partial [Polyangiaceae bacterium]